MALIFEWYPRTGGITDWEEEIKFDSWGRGAYVDGLKADLSQLPGSPKLRSETPRAGWVLKVGDRASLCDENSENAWPAWVWWAE